MLIWIIGAAGASGWLMWLITWREARLARQDAEDAHARARIAEAKSSAIRAREEASGSDALAARSEWRIAQVELSALRLSLAKARADREALEQMVKDRTPDLSEDRIEATTNKLLLYSPTRAVPNRDDG